MNKALQLSCTKGLPVRVVRSAKEKRSAYAPPPDSEQPVRYDGVYRILRAWRHRGAQEHLVCRWAVSGHLQGSVQHGGAAAQDTA